VATENSTDYIVSKKGFACLSGVPRRGRMLTYGNPFQSFEGVGIFAN
jgi:hypothetical protein